MSEKKKERRGLGRGLSALMADVNTAEVGASAEAGGGVGERMVPLDKILPNENQPRREFDEKQLTELSQSIQDKGVVQPIIVRAHPETDGMYQIVAGERRWRAAQLAALHEVPAILRDYTESETLEIAIIENIHRAELSAVEEAAGYRQLMDRFGHTQEKVAQALGKSRSHIANLLRLLNLPDDVQSLVRLGKLSAGHARALVTAEDPSVLARQILAKNLSVREAEKLVKAPKSPVPKPKPSAAVKDADTLALENDLSAAMGMKVMIEHRSGGESGRISVAYDNLDDLDRICSLLTANR